MVCNNVFVRRKTAFRINNFMGAYLKLDISVLKPWIEELLESTFSHWCILGISFEINKDISINNFKIFLSKINTIILFSKK